MRPLSAPDLALERCRLRSWQVDDAPRLVAAWQDAEISRWNAVPPEPTIEVARRWILGEAQRLDQRLSVDLVIETDDGVMGEVGLSGFSAQHRGALIGYWLLVDARGRGLATEAVSAVVAWAHDTLELDVLVARCDPQNYASHAVARRAGLTHEADDGDGSQLWRSTRRAI